MLLVPYVDMYKGIILKCIINFNGFGATEITKGDWFGIFRPV